MSELALGTVQFGLDYGLTNSSGELSDDTIVSMLDLAKQHDITLFDTAADYGNSQSRLGKLSGKTAQHRYVTKFSLPVDDSTPTARALYRESMRELRSETLEGVLFHKLSDLDDVRVQPAVEILAEARAEGVVGHIGVSVYNRADLGKALSVFPQLDLVQLPANILDSELLNSSEIVELHQRGGKVHVRSVFLQGLLLSNLELLPPFFEKMKPALQELRRQAMMQGCKVIDLILGKMKNNPLVDAVVVGATSVNELQGIADAWRAGEHTSDFELPPVPSELLDPRKWPAIRLTT